MALGVISGRVMHGDNGVGGVVLTTNGGGAAVSAAGGYFVMMHVAGTGFILYADGLSKKTGITVNAGQTTALGQIQV